jgi:TnpA family transposase
MKLGHVTASLLVQKLQAYPQQNALAQALQEYGVPGAPTGKCTVRLLDGLSRSLEV